MADLKIAVVGSGVVGIVTALELQRRIRNTEVSILSNGFYDETTSYVAAGWFEPSRDFKGETKEITQKWIDDSWHYWKNIQTSSYAGKAGVMELSGYIFSNDSEEEVRNPYIEKLVPIYRAATEKELNSISPQKFKYGSFFSSLLTDGRVYLPWALKNFKLEGGKVEHKHVKSLPELGDKYDIIVNCTGLGAQTLCDDNDLVPIKGQVVKVHAPWVKNFYVIGSDTYIIPGVNVVTLGGCREFGSNERNVDEYMSLRIRQRCETFLPSLKQAKEVETLVGLRPYRKTVRVEKEVMVGGNGKRVRVVHNYGHGGSGVTSAPGTALSAVALVIEMWAGNSKL